MPTDDGRCTKSLRSRTDDADGSGEHRGRAPGCGGGAAPQRVVCQESRLYYTTQCQIHLSAAVFPKNCARAGTPRCRAMRPGLAGGGRGCQPSHQTPATGAAASSKSGTCDFREGHQEKSVLTFHLFRCPILTTHCGHDYGSSTEEIKNPVTPLNCTGTRLTFLQDRVGEQEAAQMLTVRKVCDGPGSVDSGVSCPVHTSAGPMGPESTKSPLDFTGPSSGFLAAFNMHGLN